MDKPVLKPEVLLPHRKPMLMLSEIVSRDDHSLIASGIIADDNPLLDEGRYPGHAGIELIAQASGLFLGLKLAGDEPAPGAIVSIRDLQVYRASIPQGTVVDVRTECLGGSDTSAMFRGQVIVAGESVMETTLTVSVFPEGVLA